MREILLKFYNDLSGFNGESPIIVTYDESTNILTYRQLNKLVMVPYMRFFYLSCKGFQIGVLTPQKFVHLMKTLQTLIQDDGLDNRMTVMSIKKLGIEFYKSYASKLLSGPQRFANLELVSLKSRFLVWFIMKFYSYETKTLYKLLKNERKQNFRKGSKPEQDLESSKVQNS